MAPCGFFGDEEPLPTEEIFSPGDHVVGPPDAEVELAILFDPSCPACAHLNTQINRIREAFAENGLEDRLPVRYLPLRLYEETLPATQALWLLRGRPAFNALKDRLANAEAAITSTARLRPLLAGLGLDAPALIRRIEAGEGRRELAAVTRHTRQLGLEALPQILINDRPLPASRRNRSADCLVRVLLDELEARSEGEMVIEVVDPGAAPAPEAPSD